MLKGIRETANTRCALSIEKQDSRASMRSRGYRVIRSELRKGVEEGVGRGDDYVDLPGFQRVDWAPQCIGGDVR